jgi:hypothetical protein
MSGGSSRSRCLFGTREAKLGGGNIAVVGRMSGQDSVVSGLVLRGFGWFGDSSSSAVHRAFVGESGSRPAGVDDVWCPVLRYLLVGMLVRRDGGNTVKTLKTTSMSDVCLAPFRTGRGTVAVPSGELRWRAIAVWFRSHAEEAPRVRTGCTRVLSRDGRARGSRVLAATPEPLLRAKLVKLDTPDHEWKVATSILR